MSESVPDEMWGCGSRASWQNLPIVSYLPRETQAVLKQGHIFAGYFGLICKSIDANRTRECLLSVPPPHPSHLETGYLGFEGFNCHEVGDNTPHLEKERDLKRDKQAPDGTGLSWIASQRRHCSGHQRRLMGRVISQSAWQDTLGCNGGTNSKESTWIQWHHYPSCLTLIVFWQARGGHASCWPQGWLVLEEDESIWIASSGLAWHALCVAVNHPLEGLVWHYLRKSCHLTRSRVWEYSWLWQGVHVLVPVYLCVNQLSLNSGSSINVCIPSSRVHRGCTLRGIYIIPGESADFQAPLPSRWCSKATTRVCLVFSAVSPRLSVPLRP